MAHFKASLRNINHFQPCFIEGISGGGGAIIWSRGPLNQANPQRSFLNPSLMASSEICAGVLINKKTLRSILKGLTILAWAGLTRKIAGNAHRNLRRFMARFTKGVTAVKSHEPLAVALALGGVVDPLVIASQAKMVNPFKIERNVFLFVRTQAQISEEAVRLGFSKDSWGLAWFDGPLDQIMLPPPPEIPSIKQGWKWAMFLRDITKWGIGFAHEYHHLTHGHFHPIEKG